MDRRTFTLSALGAAALGSMRLSSAAASEVAKRAIPSTGEEIPIIGLGTNRYGVDESDEARAPLRESLQRFRAWGGGMIDTAPMYRTSESVLGDLIAELGMRKDVFLATKVDKNSAESARTQMLSSHEKLKSGTFDLMQIHNLRGWQTSLPLLEEWKRSGRARYTGITTSRSSQYAELEKILAKHDLDFVQLNYSLEQRESAERLMPLAADRGIGVIINRAFGGGRLFRAVASKQIPDWAKEFGCESWAQFLLKYALSHPAATVAIPGMTKARHVDDNFAAATTRMPSAEERRRQERFFDEL
ncbi:MAG: aldo/keto reductase [Woeseiaceae bacterium]|nr:aldo/keto reductase [Woeseiaceae bacterium]